MRQSRIIFPEAVIGPVGAPVGEPPIGSSVMAKVAPLWI
jgi:hypothetical protein